MAPTSALGGRFPQPRLATNAVLVITSAYDRGDPSNPRNVQVVEMSFFERAVPGTFADWLLHRFTDQQLAEPALGGPVGDPDGDGVANLAEFAVGGDPAGSDSSLAALQHVPSPPDTFAFSFRELKNPGDVQHRFETSTNLVNWVEATPSQLTIVANLPDAYLRAAVFPVQSVASFFRVRFLLQSDP